jgi:murein endopeptidase
MLPWLLALVALLLFGAFALGAWYGSDAPSRAQVWQEMRTPGRRPFAEPRVTLSQEPHMQVLMGEIERNRGVLWRGSLSNVRTER